ncbi:MAG: glycine--tRNA ligase subunit beta [Pseudomonadota bacterium]
MSNTTASFLVEIGTEELPPKSLLSLSNDFMSLITDQLDDLKLSYELATPLASPRRLAVKIDGLQVKQDDFVEEKLGPPIKAAYDKDGEPTKVAHGFARSNGLSLDELTQKETSKGVRLAAVIEHKGKESQAFLPEVVEHALTKLPIPKRMRWGNTRSEFIRPVHWVLMLLNDEVIDANLFGLPSGNTTRGHRFHHPEKLVVAHADEYEHTLETKAYVVVNGEKRKQRILEGVKQAAESKKGVAKIDDALLDEVTALVEWPVVLSGDFDQAFLNVPSEALISSMQEHQKYFPVVNEHDQLMPHFITVSNIESSDPALIISGNERVIRPRLSDAAFFFDTDKKDTLMSRRDALKKVVFQKQLGSLYDKTERIEALACYLSSVIDNGDTSALSRAAELCKADLTTNMVLEFSDLQGIAGSYYAAHDSESDDVALSIKEHYLPKFSGDRLPSSHMGTLLAIADRVDTLVGIFGINQIPTGSKDPFGLRRASLSVLRLLIENNLDVDLKPLFEMAVELYSDNQLSNPKTVDQSVQYVMERLRSWYEEQSIDVHVYLAVDAKGITTPLNFDQRVQATSVFSQLEVSDSLASANKRVSNLLEKATGDIPSINESLFLEEQERVLFSAMTDAKKDIEPLVLDKAYEDTLVRLAQLESPVDAFFEHVMVMADDESVRDNRLALLSDLRNMFLNVADISFLVKK